MRAARYLGVPPWELARMDVKWRTRALMAQGAEEFVAAERRRMEMARR